MTSMVWATSFVIPVWVYFTMIAPGFSLARMDRRLPEDLSRVLVLYYLLYSSLQYIARDLVEEFYNVSSYPDTLYKKVTLLKYFHNYMSEHLLKVCILVIYIGSAPHNCTFRCICQLQCLATGLSGWWNSGRETHRGGSAPTSPACMVSNKKCHHSPPLQRNTAGLLLTVEVTFCILISGERIDFLYVC